jgi:hypothetical protein
MSSCGLKYTPTESPATFEQNRHTAVENYIKKEIASTGSEYAPIAFGETQTIKPISYKQLDSLYALKYEKEKKHQTDKQLDERIEAQRMVALNDTNRVIYIEDHIFSLGKGDTLEIYSGLFQMKKELIIEDVILKESVFLPKRYGELYKEYLFEESFLFPGNLASGEEQNFYSFFKQPIEGFSKAEKDALILHTLKLMEIGAKISSINTNALLKKQTTTYFHGASYGNFKEIFSEIKEVVELNEKGKEIVIGYVFDYSYTEKTSDSTVQPQLYRMEYDAYLRLTNVTKL